MLLVVIFSLCAKHKNRHIISDRLPVIKILVMVRILTFAMECFVREVNDCAGRIRNLWRGGT
jgi:hypothetical protein